MDDFSDQEKSKNQDNAS